MAFDSILWYRKAQQTLDFANREHHRLHGHDLRTERVREIRDRTEVAQ